MWRGGRSLNMRFFIYNFAPLSIPDGLLAQQQPHHLTQKKHQHLLNIIQGAPPCALSASHETARRSWMAIRAFSPSWERRPRTSKKWRPWESLGPWAGGHLWNRVCWGKQWTAFKQSGYGCWKGWVGCILSKRRWSEDGPQSAEVLKNHLENSFCCAEAIVRYIATIPAEILKWPGGTLHWTPMDGKQNAISDFSDNFS